MARIGYPVIIALVGFGVVFRYALLDYTLMSGDAIQEFRVYSLIVETGKWQIVPNYALVSSCLFTTYFPAIFQRAFGTDLLMTFKLFPCFIIPFLPVVIYYIAKRWISPFYASLASWFVMGQIYFLWALSFSRIMVALVFFGLALLVVFNEDMRFRTKIGLSILLSACLVMAHYGTTFGSLIVIGVVIVVMLSLKAIRRYHYPNLRAMSAFWVILMVWTVVWLGIINGAPLSAGVNFVRDSAKLQTYGENALPDSPTKEVIVGVTEDVPFEVEKEYGFFSLETRSEVIQVAFGKTLHIMRIPQKIEFAFSWLTILLMTWGLVLTTKRWGLKEDRVLLMLACYSTIVAGVVIPTIGIRYGIARVYFHMVLVLAPCFIIGSLDVAKRLKVPIPLALMAVLIPYGLCTSGIMHSFFGLAR